MREDVNYEEVYKWLDLYKETKSEKVKQQLQNLIVVACMPLVQQISRGLARRSTDPLDDIIQVGSVGLIKAVKSYNTSVSQNFKAYLTYCVTGEIRHYLRDKCTMIKVPREVQELAYRVYVITKELMDELGDKPTDLDIARKLQTDVERVHEVIDVDRRKNLLSLEYTKYLADDSQVVLYDKIADTADVNNQDFQEVKIMMRSAIKKLEPELQKVIHLHFYEDLNQRQIAGVMDISQMQVSRLLKRALSDIFEMIKDLED